MTAKEMLNCKIYFDETIDIDKINGLKIFDKFRNVMISSYKKLPSAVTHLVLFDKIDYLNKNYIPSTVTHLWCANINVLSTDNCVPSTVTHLFFYHYMAINQFKIFHIPSSITHLSLGFYHFYYFYHDQLFNYQVPITVAQISINGLYNNIEKSILTNGFSNGVTKIFFTKRFLSNGFCDAIFTKGFSKSYLFYDDFKSS